jgi:uncharacterized protein
LIYLDASALVPLVIRERRSAELADFIATFVDLTSSDFAFGEASSAIARHVRNGEISTSEAHSAFDALDALAANLRPLLDLRSDDVRQATSFIRRLELPLKLPDALHLAICRRTGAALLTFDHQLVSNAAALTISTAPRLN